MLRTVSARTQLLMRGCRRCMSNAASSSSQNFDDFATKLVSNEKNVPPVSSVASHVIGSKTAETFVAMDAKQPKDVVDLVLYASVRAEPAQRTFIMQSLRDDLKTVRDLCGVALCFSQLCAVSATLFECGQGRCELNEHVIGEVVRVLAAERPPDDCSSLTRFAAAAKSAAYKFQASDLAVINRALLSLLAADRSPTEILAILKLLPECTQEVMHKVVSTCVTKVVSVMTLSESIAILRQYSQRHCRNLTVINQLVAQISQAHDRMTLKQVADSLQAAADLTLFDARLIRKAVHDLVDESNVLSNWNLTTQIMNAFSRLRIADAKAWEKLSKWCSLNTADARYADLSMALSAMAFVGIHNEYSVAFAKEIASRADKQRAKNVNVWLNTISSLAFFKVLPAHLAESVLNSDFYNNLVKKYDKDPQVLVYYLMRLMEINAYAQCMIPLYKGQLLDSTAIMAAIPNFNELARNLKYSKGSEIDVFFRSSLYFVTPKTHCKEPRVLDTGIYAEGEIRPVAPGESKCVALSEWPEDHKGNKAILYFPWAHLHYTFDVDPSPSGSPERHLLGHHQLSISLLREQGYDPIIITEPELKRVGQISTFVPFFKNLVAS